MKKQKFFTIGGATFDIFIKPEVHGIMRFTTSEEIADWLCLNYGGKVRIEHMEESFGGGGTNTAVGFSRMGFDAAFVGKVGSEYGDRVIGNLESAGVDTSFIKSTSRDKTGFSTILSTFKGDRTVLAYSGANCHFSAKDLPLKELEKADWIFLNHLSEKNSHIPGELLKILKKNPHIKLAWNPGHEQIEAGITKWKELLRRTDILFLNKEEASRFSRTPFKLAGLISEDSGCFVPISKPFLPPYADDISEIMMKFLRAGVKKVVITDGQNGAQATDGEKLYFCPVVSTKRLDTTGAGDAFASGFTSAIATGLGLKTALKYGTLNSYNVIHFSGAQAGLLTRGELEKRLKKVDICVTGTKLT